MIKPRMIDPSRLFRIFKYLVLALLFISAVPVLNRPSTREKYTQVLRSFKDEKRLFVADFLESEVDGSFNGSELARLCASKVWHPEDKALILTCEPLSGGIGGVKNGILQCIRFSIEIGAQLILPRIIRRSPADISNVLGDQHSRGQPIDYMFSSEHLLTSLHAHCPQMRVHRSLDDLYDRPSLLKPLAVNLAMLTDEFANVDGEMTPVAAADPAALRVRFDELYERELPPGSRRHPVRVDLQNAQGSPFTWPALGDGPAARRDLGRLLRVRDDARVLAASALYNLARRFGLPADPRAGLVGGPPPPRPPAAAAHHRGGGWTTTAAAAGRAASASKANGANTTAAAPAAPAAPAARLVGVHLRTEMDAQNRGLRFPDYESQASYFLGYLEGTGKGVTRADGTREGRVVYLATGLLPGDDDVRRFRARAAELGATVVTKREVLGDGEVAVLDGHLTWDQRALVDYEVLLRVGFLVGVVESSLAWNLAMRRGNAAAGGGGDGGYLGLPAVAAAGGDPEEGKTGLDPGKLVMWDDRYSRLYGRAGRGAVIFKGMWP